MNQQSPTPENPIIIHIQKDGFDFKLRIQKEPKKLIKPPEPQNRPSAK